MPDYVESQWRARTELAVFGELPNIIALICVCSSFRPACVGKEKSIDRIFIQAEVYTYPIAIGTVGSACRLSLPRPFTRSSIHQRLSGGTCAWPMGLAVG